MKISIITAVYNNVATIKDTIESVLSQTYEDIEYIIIDGASVDGTAELINGYRDKISIVISEPDMGMYDAMNKGISMATGEIIAILHADDFYKDADVISKVAKVFNQSLAESVYGDLVYINHDNSKVSRYWTAGHYKVNSFLYGWMPPHPAFFVRSKIYKQYGTFNLSLRTAADYELMLRFIHKHQISTAYLPEVLVYMRTGGVSNSSLKNRINANKEDRLAWKLNNIEPYFFTLLLKPLRKLGQFFHSR